jgi:two-component system, OmpR family, KDP operon response regulator KdpE
VAQILLVEDDAEIRRALIRALTERGHAMSSTATAMDGIQRILDDTFDLVVLDLGLPDVDGRDALRMLRSVSRIPVIVATARDDEAAIVDALDNGADDYLIKPFGSAQLEARIRAVLRRIGEDGDEPRAVVVGELRIDPAAREATLRGNRLDLTPREFEVLSYLAARVGTVVTRRELLVEVWRLPGGGDKTVDVHLSWLRRKLGESATRPRYLHTIRGVGVKLAAPPR